MAYKQLTQEKMWALQSEKKDAIKVEAGMIQRTQGVIIAAQKLDMASEVERI